jgi:hypothetical protein
LQGYWKPVPEWFRFKRSGVLSKELENGGKKKAKPDDALPGKEERMV